MTDSRGGTGRQDEALRPEQVRGTGVRTEKERERLGEKERGMRWTASDADVAAVYCWMRVCLFVSVRVRERESVCVCLREEKGERH